MGQSVLGGGRTDQARLFADAGLERRQRSLYLGGVALSEIADGAGTPDVRLQRRRDPAAVRGARRSLGAGAASDRVRRQGELQPRRPPRAARSGRRRGHRLRRRAGARARRGLRARPHRVQRRRKDGRGADGGGHSRHRPYSPGVRRGAGVAGADRRAGRPAGHRRHPGESGRHGRHPPVHRDRAGRDQVRRPGRPGGAARAWRWVAIRSSRSTPSPCTSAASCSTRRPYVEGVTRAARAGGPSRGGRCHRHTRARHRRRSRHPVSGRDAARTVDAGGGGASPACGTAVSP